MHGMPLTGRGLIMAATIWFTPKAASAQRLSHDEVIADIRWLVGTIESTHPDPYTAFGGKLAFHRQARALRDGVPAVGMTAVGLYEYLVPFFGELADGHTRVSAPSGTGGETTRNALPVRFRVATDGVFVYRTSAGFEDLLGHRLVSVEGVDLGELTGRASGIAPVENAFGAMQWAAAGITFARYGAQMFGRELDTLRLTTEDPNGGETTHQLPYLAPEAVLLNPPLGNGAAEAISWQMLDEANVGYLRLRSIQGREAFQDARHRQDLPGYVADYYRRFLNREAPADLDSALAGVPCFTETVWDLLMTMRARASKYLIVDVRGNGGGWSALMVPLYLLLFGDEYLDYEFPETWVDVASERFLQMSAWTVSDLKAEWGDQYEVGDYRFQTPGRPRGDQSLADYAASLATMGCGLAGRAVELNGRPLYQPTVIVLLDPGTFSAGYQLVYKLWHLGAILVGTPSAQAGNAFTNVAQADLPNSGLHVSISRSAQLFFPDDEERGRVLMPHFPMRWREFARYAYGPDAELRYALDLITAREIEANRERSP